MHRILHCPHLCIPWILGFYFQQVIASFLPCIGNVNHECEQSPRLVVLGSLAFRNYGSDTGRFWNITLYFRDLCHGRTMINLHAVRLYTGSRNNFPVALYVARDFRFTTLIGDPGDPRRRTRERGSNFQSVKNCYRLLWGLKSACTYRIL